MCQRKSAPFSRTRWTRCHDAAAAVLRLRLTVLLRRRREQPGQAAEGAGSLARLARLRAASRDPGRRHGPRPHPRPASGDRAAADDAIRRIFWGFWNEAPDA